MKKKLLFKKPTMFSITIGKFCFIIFATLTCTLSLQAQVTRVNVPASKVKVLKFMPINSGKVESPAVIDPNAIYSNVTNFTGSALTNGGDTTLPNGSIITTLIADSLGLMGTPPYSINAFTFSLASFNTIAVYARPLIRFYAADGTNNGPGTIIAAYDFDTISFPASGVTLLSANIAPLSITTSGIWAAMSFDNDTAASPITAAQLNNLGQGTFNPVDRGSSQDDFFASDSAGSFETGNPVGGIYDFGGPPVANFGWELISSVPLPITLTDFKVVRNGATNSVTWGTSQELNSNYFALEHSNNGNDFKQIAEIKAAGNSSIARNYTYNDVNPPKGINYYRLRLVDIDNSTRFSKIISVRNTGLVKFSIFPNPVKNSMLINMDVEKTGEASISIVDFTGRKVYDREFNITQGNNNLSVDVNNLSRGTYYLKVQLSDESFTKKFDKL